MDGDECQPFRLVRSFFLFLFETHTPSLTPLRFNAPKAFIFVCSHNAKIMGCEGNGSHTFHLFYIDHNVRTTCLIVFISFLYLSVFRPGTIRLHLELQYTRELISKFVLTLNASVLNGIVVIVHVDDEGRVRQTRFEHQVDIILEKRMGSRDYKSNQQSVYACSNLAYISSVFFNRWRITWSSLESTPMAKISD